MYERIFLIEIIEIIEIVDDKLEGFQKFQLFQLKLGIHSCVICPLIGCICLLLSGNVCPFFIEIIVIIEILRTTIPLMKLLCCSYVALI